MDQSRRVVLRAAAVTLGAALLATSVARAEYLCDHPPRDIDYVACKKAAEGPEALREFIRRMRSIETLYFYDYVNEARLEAWREKERKAEPPVLVQQALRSE
jgi:hypothetical protein